MNEVLYCTWIILESSKVTYKMKWGEQYSLLTCNEAFSFSGKSSSYNTRMYTIGCHICLHFLQHSPNTGDSPINSICTFKIKPYPYFEETNKQISLLCGEQYVVLFCFCLWFDRRNQEREKEKKENELTWSLRESSLVCKTLAIFESAYARVAS